MSFLVDQSNIYIESIQLHLISWITEVLISCLRVACLVQRENEHNSWYITGSEWRRQPFSFWFNFQIPCNIQNQLFSLVHFMGASALFAIFSTYISTSHLRHYCKISALIIMVRVLIVLRLTFQTNQIIRLQLLKIYLKGHKIPLSLGNLCFKLTPTPPFVCSAV